MPNIFEIFIFTCAAVCVFLGGWGDGGGPRVAGAGRLEVRMLGGLVRVALPGVRDAALDAVRIEQFAVDQTVAVAAHAFAALLALGVLRAAALAALLPVLLHHDFLHVLVMPKHKFHKYGFHFLHLNIFFSGLFLDF